MDWQKSALLGAIGVVIFLLFIEWGEYQERNKPELAAPKSYQNETTPQVQPAVVDSDDDIPQIVSEAPVENPAPVNNQAQYVTVETDSLIITIDTHGGDIVQALLPKHLAELDNPNVPFTLMSNDNGRTYLARSGLFGKNGTDKSISDRPYFNVDKTRYKLKEGQERLVVDLVTEQDQVTITKRYIFNRGDYLIEVDYLIDNRSDAVWQAKLYGQIKRDTFVPPSDAGIGMQPFLGAATSTTEENYKKMDFGDIADESFKHSKEGSWVAMVQHYFVSAWIPPQDSNNTFEFKPAKNDNLFILQFTTPYIDVEPGQQKTIDSSFYAGPKDVYRLQEIAPYLDLVVDYSWLWWVAKPLFYFLNWIYSFIGNWGWSIIVLTIAVKAAFFQLSATSYRSMAKMRKLQPMMADLKTQYGSDRQRMSQELMKLYKKEKVNPMGGCLPILIQMPVFLALYWVLMESVELRHTPFLGWIDDLSVRDPYFILPLIMGVSMWFQQKLNPAPTDPTQAKIMQMMPIVFTLLFMWFPAGLVLYWVANNLISIAQQYIITRNIEKADTK